MEVTSDDLKFPKAIVARIIKDALPENAIVSNVFTFLCFSKLFFYFLGSKKCNCKECSYIYFTCYIFG